MRHSTGHFGEQTWLTRLASAGLILGLTALGAVRVGAQTGGVIELPSGSQLAQILALGTESCCVCESWPGRGIAVLTQEAWPTLTSAAGPTLQVTPSGPFGVIRVYTLLMDGRFRLDPSFVLPAYTEQETRAYPVAGGGQVVLEPSWPIGLRSPKALVASGCSLFALGEGWSLDRTRSARAGGEKPVIGFSVSLTTGGLGPLKVLNEQQFLRDRDVARLLLPGLLTGIDPLYALPQGKTRAPVLLILEPELSTVDGVKAYALRVYHLSPFGVAQFQCLGVGERGAAPGVLATGDLNGDGYDDIVVGFRGPLADRIEVFLSNRDGTFRSAPGPAPLHSETNVRAVLFGDFDGDGTTDILVMGPDRSALFTGDGTGALSKGAVLDFGLGSESGLQSAAVADFDRDGRSDTAVARGSEIRVYLGRGGGAFNAPISLSMTHLIRSAAFTASHIVVAELDDVPGPDLLVGSAATGELAVLLNRRSATEPVVFESVRDPYIGAGPSIAVAADVNRDATEDLVLVYPYARQVCVLEGSPADGTLADTFSIVRSIGAVSYPTAIAVGDLDGDEQEDIAIACAATDNVLVLYGPHRQPAGFYGALAPREELVPVGRSPSHLEIAVDGGNPRLVVLHAGSHNIYVLEFDPAAKQMRVANSAGAQLDPSPACLAPLTRLADLDRDGHPDLLLTYPETGKLAWVSAVDLLNRVLPQHELDVPLPRLAVPLLLAWGDFDSNEMPDIAVAQRGSLTILLGKVEAVCCTPGKMEYSLARQISLGTLGSPPVSMVVGDFSGDGREDIALAMSSEPHLRVWRGQGDGRFEEVPGEDLKWAAVTGQSASPSPLSGLVAVRLTRADHLNLFGYSERERGTLRAIRIQSVTSGGAVKPKPANGRLADGVIADLTGNGRNELGLLLPPTEEEQTWRLALLQASTEAGGMWQAREIVLPTQDLGPTVHMRADDLNADRVGDVVLLDTARNRLIVLAGPGFTLEAELPGLEAGTSTLAVAASADGAWIAAGRTVFYRTPGVGWSRSELHVGGGTPLAAWPAPASSGVESAELVLLVYRPADATYWLYCFDGRRLLSGNTVSSCEPTAVPASAEGEAAVLRTLLAYSGTAHPTALLGAARALLLDKSAPYAVLLVDPGLRSGGRTAVALWPWLAAKGRISVWYEEGGVFGAPTQNTLSSSVSTQSRLLAGDLNADGLRDIAAIDGGTGCVEIWFNGTGVARTEVVAGVLVFQSAIRGGEQR